ncbi:MAG: SDR family oxidoreductase [SAR324 cluster bacterium]|nr:SDR family oxidoreductase [SAR324 cluster bacterium]MCZ6531897.1 SDR family oxidoreductase [SAR324 cluster bacterium]MCZ6627192.1 SDR family oxidoreductase [SAR324 cluster bacterium]MCZ6730809.1 SDR family oxidoreductase [SAR324 cluster bacterium]MCZ6842943.1 SDR family oxidoreductase [SAR324 cluster bacterium]
MNPFDLSDKTAVVTGSSLGIGRSIAEHMARAGARVVISSRKEKACQEVAAAINRNGGQAIAVPANVSNQDHLENLIAETNKQFGPVDILVCNAAANPYYGPLTEITDEAYHKTLDTNILSLIRLFGLVAEGMAARGGGSLIVISSVGAVKATPNLGAYAISKAADLQVVRTLAAEWGEKQIRVNAILPGLVKTEFARVLWDNPDAEKKASTRLPLRRLGESDDIGPAAVFLASRAGEWMTGQSLIIDGGSLLLN